MTLVVDASCTPLDFTTPRGAEPIIIVEVLSPSDDTGRKLALSIAPPDPVAAGPAWRRAFARGALRRRPRRLSR